MIERDGRGVAGVAVASALLRRAHGLGGYGGIVGLELVLGEGRG